MGHVHQTPLGIDKGPGNDDEQWMRICVQEQYLQHQAIVVLLNHRDILWTIILCCQCGHGKGNALTWIMNNDTVV